MGIDESVKGFTSASRGIRMGVALMAPTAPRSHRLTPAPARLSLRAPASDVRTGLGLSPTDLEAAITALLDRGDVASEQDRARLCRARTALELELAAALRA